MSESILNVQLIDQRVTKLAEDLKDRFREELGLKNDQNKLKSAAFVYLVARSLLDLDPDEVFDGLVEGGGDFGVDAIYFGPPNAGEFKVTLVQGKYKQNLEGTSGFPENGIIKMADAIRIIFNPSAPFDANPRVTARIDQVRALIGQGYFPEVRAILCNNGPRWNDAAETRIKAYNFGSMVAWEHVGPEALVGLMRARKPVDVKLQLCGKALVEEHPYMRSMIGRMSVLELARLFDTFGDVLLERNIRRYLGFSGRVNQEIGDTLRDPDQRSKFYFYNNGVTIICSKFNHNPLAEKDWPVQVSGLQIVNGGQTSKTVQHMLRELGPEIGTATVLVRLYELPEDDEPLVQLITRATNSQNPVVLNDLRSSEARQKNLEEMIRELGYNYRRQRSGEDRAPNDMTINSVGNAVLAVWRQRPHMVDSGSGILTGQLYEHVFSPELNGAQAIIAVLLVRLARRQAKIGEESKSEFPASGSDYAAMLMGEYLLREIGVSIDEFDHRNFRKAVKIVEENGEHFYHNAVARILNAVDGKKAAWRFRPTQAIFKSTIVNALEDSKKIDEIAVKVVRGSLIRWSLNSDLVQELTGAPLSIDLPPPSDPETPA
ncbi:AIPR family protein [Azospirillum argentinense]|uniref:Abortive phage resistance protein n=1 Tax=Azospirillum brasilense TaxID=192 RepID=A0A4D8Q1C3_AZOBR|nr:AIPR family protein [Azospirillum argentinense]QCO03441.1 abortive phage resistance protein [Azospirillum argentinense]